MATQLDHIILLMTPADFKNVPSWLSDNFTIIDGGKHSKGTSQNKLIIFQDGTYLELFSWVDPKPEGVESYADFPSWGSKPEGYIIDWALTGPNAHGKYEEIMAQIRELEAQGEQLGVTYDQPKEGGRRRMDGKELQWYATRPRQVDTAQSSSQIDVPFFCHDISDRSLRVPYTAGSTSDWPRIITHPCGAVGVQSVTLTIPASRLSSCAKLYEGILGVQREQRLGNEHSTVAFAVASPAQSADKSGKPTCTVFLTATEQGTTESSTQAGTNIQALTLWTSTQERGGEQLNAEGFGTKITLR